VLAADAYAVTQGKRARWYGTCDTRFDWSEAALGVLRLAMGVIRATQQLLQLSCTLCKRQLTGACW
jgi:hypothetical protein